MLTFPSAAEPLESRIAPASIALGTSTVASGSVTLDGQDTFSATLNATGDSGKLVVTGTVALQGAGWELTLGSAPDDQDSWILIDNDDTDPIVGTFAGLPEGKLFQVGDYFLKITYAGGDGNDVVLTSLVPRVKISPDGKTATFSDVDGDLVSAKTTAGSWTRDMFELVPSGDFINGAQVEAIHLGAGFTGAKITLTAKRDLFGGNGFVNVTTFDGGTSAITSLDIDGDVDQLNLSLAGTTPLKSVTVHSLGQMAIDRLLGTHAKVDFGRPVKNFTIEADAFSAHVTGQQMISRLVIGGSLLGDSSIGAGQIGALVVAHDIVGAFPEYTPIYAYGAVNSPVSGVDVAIGSITVGGRVERAVIQAGAGAGMLSGAYNADASIGKITIGGDLITSLITAGTTWGSDTISGTADDAVYAGQFVRNSDALTAEIGSIIVRGQVIGTSGSTTDSYGISSEMIRKATFGPVKFQFSSGAHNSDDFFFLSPTGPGPTGLQSDFVMLEVLA